MSSAVNQMAIWPFFTKSIHENGRECTLCFFSGEKRDDLTNCPMVTYMHTSMVLILICEIVVLHECYIEERSAHYGFFNREGNDDLTVPSYAEP